MKQKGLCRIRNLISMYLLRTLNEAVHSEYQGIAQVLGLAVSMMPFTEVSSSQLCLQMCRNREVRFNRTLTVLSVPILPFHLYPVAEDLNLLFIDAVLRLVAVWVAGSVEHSERTRRRSTDMGVTQNQMAS
jgi:hypothetical protein